MNGTRRGLVTCAGPGIYLVVRQIVSSHSDTRQKSVA